MIDKIAVRLGNGVMAVPINRIPKTALFNAVQVVEYAKAYIISSDNYAKFNIENGGPDVRIEPMAGRQYFLGRKQFVESFILTNGNRIKLRLMKNNRGYMVKRSVEIPVKAVRIPNEYCVQRENGRIIKNIAYIVYEGNLQDDSSGNLDTSGAKLLNYNQFKSQFIIPMQEIVDKIQAKVGELHEDSDNGHYDYDYGYGSAPDDSNYNSVEPSDSGSEEWGESGDTTNYGYDTEYDLGSDDVPSSMNNSPDSSRNTHNFGNDTYDDDTYDERYEAIRRIVSESGSTRGFVLSIGGEIKRVTNSEVRKYCKKGMISNLRLKEKQDGTVSIVGNGIKLKDLPSELA